MIARSISCCVLLLAGCGAPAIVDASRTLATARGCEAAQLTMTQTGATYAVSGCGADAVYECPPGAAECSETQGGADTSWVSEGRAAMAAIAGDVLACNDGESFTLQVRFDDDGQPQGLASDPELGGDQRVCVGRLVLDQVALGDAGGERLLAYTYGGAAEPAAGLPVAEDPVDEEPMEEPVEEPSEDGSESAPPEGDEGTALPDDLIE